MCRAQLRSVCARVACAALAVWMLAPSSVIGDDTRRAAPVGVSTTTPIRETWYVVRDGDLTWGVTHLRIDVLSPGRLLGGRAYTVESRMLMELLGTPQEMRGRSTVFVDADLAPLRVESEMIQMSGTVRVEGLRSEEGIVIRVIQGERETTSVHRFDDELGLVADVAIEAWLHRLPATTTATRVRLLDTGGGTVREVDVELVERSEDGVTWRIAAGAVPGEHTIRLDRDGVGVEQVHRFPAMRIVTHPDASQIELVHRKFGDAELLMHTVDRELPPLRRIAELTVELRWRDIETDAFQFGDSRQRVKSITTEDDLTVATVVVHRPVGLHLDVQRPVDIVAEPTLAPYLGESDFIEPNDLEIARTAAEIVGGETSARAAAEKLCEWVVATIETTMIAETLSGSEVLRRRVGKCTEFATLYASLARSVGIPTRIALGQRLFSGGGGGTDGAQWGGHMWNEVWLGEWVPVDASHGEFGGSPALLKLVHSDGVVGTQDVRWRVAESLAVSVVDVTTIAGSDDPDRAAVVDGLVDGEDGGVWTNVARGVRFRLPAAGWRIENVDAPGALLIRIRPPADEDPGDSAMIHFSAFDFPPGMPVAAINRARVAHHRSQLKALEMLDDRAITVAGADGHRCAFRGIHADAPPVMATELLWSRDGTGCLLNLLSAEPLHEAWRAHLEQILASFEFLAD